MTLEFFPFFWVPKFCAIKKLQIFIDWKFEFFCCCLLKSTWKLQNWRERNSKSHLSWCWSCSQWNWYEGTCCSWTTAAKLLKGWSEDHKIDFKSKNLNRILWDFSQGTRFWNEKWSKMKEIEKKGNLKRRTATVSLRVIKESSSKNSDTNTGIISWGHKMSLETAAGV